MRGTVHLLTADDALGLRPVMQPRLDRQLAGNHAKTMTAVDVDELSALARQALADGPVGGRQLGEALQRRWPHVAATELGMAARVHLPLVQVPPRGLWCGSGQPTYTPVEQWLGRAPEPYPRFALPGAVQTAS